MKKLVYLSTILFAIIMVACNGKGEDENLIEDFTTQEGFKVPRVLMNAKLGNVPIPDHTIVTYFDEHSVQLKFPKNVFAYVTDADGTLDQMENMCYECSCSGSGGCNVFYVQGNFACSECSGSCTGTRVKCDTNNERGIEDGAFIFVDFNEGVKFIDKQTDIQDLVQAKEFFFDIPEVKAALMKLNKKYYSTEVVTEQQIIKRKAEMVGLNMYGVLIGYPMPATNLLEKDGGYASVTCSCQSGSAGCKKKSSLAAGAWCEGGDCSTCRMEVEGNNE